ncbi:uncharacterized protein [Amphiura filiformis]|uniref:uncharacterized protein n=1 Tax=Amphiura filiformis TaxID=82378 RepID=UPI003B2189E9
MNPGDKQQSRKTIIVKASGDVSVTAFDNEWASGDGFIVIPTSHLGRRHYVASYQPVPSRIPSFFCASSLSNDTRINIKTPTGHVHNAILGQFESMWFDNGGTEDLSGTLIQSDQPIAVISGALTAIPLDSGFYHIDGLIGQLPSTELWGQSYTLAPFLSLNSGYLCRVYADVTTKLFISDKKL